MVSKILLQMNAKIGLPLWLTPKPAGLDNKTMLIGVDIYKKLIKSNNKKDSSKNSCIGFVSTLDAQFSKFFSKILIAKPGLEVCNQLGVLIKQAVKQFFLYNKKEYLPERIIVFRDGVGEGQLEAVA